MTNQEDDLVLLFLLSFLGHMLSRRPLELLRHSRISLPTWNSLNNLELPKEPEVKMQVSRNRGSKDMFPHYGSFSLLSDESIRAS